MNRRFRRSASAVATAAVLAFVSLGAADATADDDLAARGCGEQDCKIDNANVATPLPDEPAAALGLIDGDGPPIGAYATRLRNTAINVPTPGAAEPDVASAADIADDVIRATTPPPNAEIAGPPDPGDLGAVLASTDIAVVSSGQIADGSVTSARIERTAPEFRIRNEPISVAAAQIVNEPAAPEQSAVPADLVTIDLDVPGKELASAMADGEALMRKPAAPPSLSALDLAIDDDPMARINGRLVHGLDRGPRDEDALNESVQSLLRDTASVPAAEAVQSPDHIDASVETALQPLFVPRRPPR